MTFQTVEQLQAQIASLTAKCEMIRDSPSAVHRNILSGHIATPSISQIIHIYGKEALLAALQPKEGNP